ncbi:MAG TPA: penicillin acylase family protein, partial [Herpetosiphonaceae bacterium]|nr:penicillin acylase family protein [Herpetosiphonaceae bacterium]
MRRIRQGLAMGLGGLAALAGLAGGAFYGRARRALPPTRGRLDLDGPEAPVEILRDRWGVPHIYARGDGDLLWAQGFVHAGERLWQMEFQRRIATGRLAEMIGPAALDIDRFIHTLGLPAAARADADRLGDEARTLAERYVAGVNAAIERMGRSRTPIEFAVLRHRATPWTLVDTLAWGKVVALAMAGNWEAEIIRAQMVARLGPERAAALEPDYPAAHHTTVADIGALLGQITREGARAAAPTLGFGGEGVESLGSNAWAVHAGRSRTGRPILAADPHLSLGVPSVWMENHLCGGSLHVTGAAFPGVPGVLIGHNERIGWGITNAGIDAQDLYIERLDPARRRYETPSGWRDVGETAVEIAVRGKPAVRHVIQSTRHGPLLASLDPAAEAPAVSDGGVRIKPNDLPADLDHTDCTYGLALRWTVHEAGAPFEAVLAMNRAADWPQFRAALAHWSDPVMNFVYAGPDGVGYQLGGRVPYRPNGPSLTPARGWTDEAEWDGFLPFEHLPHAFNPASGVVVSANNRVVDPADYPYHLSQEWMNGYRAERINAVLTAQPAVGLEECARLQLDFFSQPGRELAALVRDLLPPPADPVARAAHAALVGWDGVLDAA